MSNEEKKVPNKELGSIEARAHKRGYFLGKDCDSLVAYLTKRWGDIQDYDRFFILRIMIEDKRCSIKLVLPFLQRLMSSSDRYYRNRALYYIGELDAKNQRDFFIHVFKEESDEHNRGYALILLAEAFPNQKDEEILRLALSAYDDLASGIGLRLAAGAAMMYQLDIPHDEDGRPAWWDDHNFEELNHPAILQAVMETKKILKEFK